MLELVDIIQEGNIVTCTVLPEGKREEAFTIKVDVVEDKTVYISEEPSIYSRQAYGKIMSVYEEKGAFPERVVSYWY